MNKWQLHEAKNKLSNIVEIAMHGTPQCITRRGEDAVMILGIKEYQKLTKQTLNFSEFLLSGPKFDDLAIERVKDKSREIEL